MRATGFAAVCTALLLLSGCSGEEKPAAPPVTDVAQLASVAAAGTQKARSSKIALETTADDGRKVVVTSSGLYEGPNSKFSMVAEVAGEKRDLIYADGVLYYHLSDTQVQELKTGKEWVKITAGGKDSLSAANGALMTNVVETMDPTRTIERISKSGKVTKSEQGDVNGTAATRYVLDLAGAPAELWLDAEQRPVQVSMGKATVKYDSWASDVVIIAPPPEAVGDSR
ncbi:hypothetical protein [Amycolatopsis sp. EV170708-02-1]|uniref:hypothetical protein n=1 Tax=Amycolatopsis sp. EV170708-02-1 TaxID=2919322 RepID=UPI001F0BD911|nr:hypothetical protein [Amycolatopsis sp. EV170708-02-1]UMP06152.1 hypothetical protein MJQ72_15670 [Amycolatopsis sp. EV170708-02-1]